MVSRLTVTATLFAFLAAGSVAAVAGARSLGAGTTDRAAAVATVKQVRIIELPRVTIVAKRLPPAAE